MKSKYSKIALAGLSGTGKGTISKMITETLDFKRISGGDFFREIADEKGMSMTELDQALGKDEALREDLDRMVDQRTKDYGENNENFVVEARLAAHFVPDAFKILLLCDDRRYQRIADRDEITVEEAKEETNKRESTYSTRYGELYNLADFDDPKYYDLVIDTSEMTPDEILEEIINNIT